jgi:IS5 family transposase
VREVIHPQLGLGERPIGEIKLDLKSRDDIPKLLLGLQHIYVNPALREEVFAILREVIPERAGGGQASAALGRPGLAQWRILVLGVVRLGLDADYDRLQELATQHRTLRQMLGHSEWDDPHRYAVQTLKDNLRLFTPEVLDRINAVVVRAGHALVKKSPEEALRGRCDSFVVETDVHFPTDSNLLYDALRKVIEESAQLSGRYDLGGWRQHRYRLRQCKRQYRRIQTRKHSTSQDIAKREVRQAAIRDAHRDYLALAGRYLEDARTTRAEALAAGCGPWDVAALDGFMAHAARQIDQIRRRVLLGETIPHAEKVFSIFQPHTEWISKGKAGVPVELGLRVCVLEDQHRFILHHQVMVQQTDDHIAVAMVAAAQARFPALRAVSFDQGFWSPANRQALDERLDLVGLPKKGRLAAQDLERETDPAFVAARRQHAAVESAINGLESFGLDRCPDHGLTGFRRYVALAVLARNLQRLGVVVRERLARRPSRHPRPPAQAA